MTKRPRAHLRIGFSVLICNFTMCAAQAQAPEAATPRFEVTTVKQNVSGSTASSESGNRGDRFTARNVPLYFLILDAYELRDNQLIGAPEWVREKAYDVVGTFPAGTQPSLHEMHLMLQQMLRDRFGLQLHHDQRDLPAYDLVLARKDGRLGPHIHESTLDCAAWIAAGRPKLTSARPSPVAPNGTQPVCAMLATRKWLSGGSQTMADLTGPLQSMVGRPVVDKTGLTKSYDIDLQWSPAGLPADNGASSSPDSADAPSIFTALEEQLGLKLVAHKETFDVIAVDAVTPPTPD